MAMLAPATDSDPAQEAGDTQQPAAPSRDHDIPGRGLLDESEVFWRGHASTSLFRQDASSASCSPTLLSSGSMSPHARITAATARTADCSSGVHSGSVGFLRSWGTPQ